MTAIGPGITLQVNGGDEVWNPTGTASPGKVIGYLREHEITLTWNPAAATVQARATQTDKTVAVKTN